MGYEEQLSTIRRIATAALLMLFAVLLAVRRGLADQGGPVWPDLLVLALFGGGAWISARVAARAIRRAQETFRLREEELDVLYTVVREVTSTLESAQVLQRITETASRVFGQAGVTVYRVEGARLYLLTQIGYTQPPREIPLDRGVCGRVARTGIPTFLPDTSLDPDFISGDPPAISEICIPIRLRNQVWGLLNIESLGPTRLSARQYTLALTIGEHLNLALDHAQDHADAQRRAITDGLTGLYNHAYFYQRLTQELHRSARFGHCVSLLMVDLDDFRHVNNTYGHQAGDAVLAFAAQVLQQCVRADVDLVARYGGEEFAILLPEADGPSATEVAERIVARLRRSRVEISPGIIITHPTASIGIVTGTGGELAADIVGAADQALYQVKSSGKNGIRALVPA